MEVGSEVFNGRWVTGGLLQAPLGNESQIYSYVIWVECSP